jgi:hypothetical protein
MARLSCEKRAELESFWRSHHEGWECSTLVQREYWEAQGLSLKRFGNWRAKFKTETAAVQGKLLCPSLQGSQTIRMFSSSRMVKFLQLSLNSISVPAFPDKSRPRWNIARGSSSSRPTNAANACFALASPASNNAKASS